MKTIFKETFCNIKISDSNFRDPIKISGDKTVLDALNLFSTIKQEVLVVACGEKEAILSMGDLCKIVRWNSQQGYDVKLAEIARFDVLSVDITESLWEALVIMSSSFIRNLLIVENSKVVGILDMLQLLSIIVNKNEEIFKNIKPIANCLTDIIKHDEFEFGNVLTKQDLNIILYQKIDNVNIILKNPLLCDVNDDIEHVYNQIISSKKKNAIITEYSIQIIGIVSEHDILKKIIIPKRFDLSLKDVITFHPHKLLQYHNIINAIYNMYYYKYRKIILVDKDLFPISIITAGDILNYMINIWAT